MEDFIKKNLEISGKKLEVISERQQEVALYHFLLKDQGYAINENVE